MAAILKSIRVCFERVWVFGQHVCQVSEHWYNISVSYSRELFCLSGGQFESYPRHFQQVCCVNTSTKFLKKSNKDTRVERAYNETRTDQQTDERNKGQTHRQTLCRFHPRVSIFYMPHKMRPPSHAVHEYLMPSMCVHFE